MKIALVADWLTAFGGAEQVIGSFHALWPDTPVFTTVAHPKIHCRIPSINIHVDKKLQFLYSILRRHEPLLPLMPKAIETINYGAFDIILSSSHAIGKGVIPSPNSLHICYCHTPMRYAWEMEEEYLNDFRIPSFIKPILRKQLKKLRRWDMTTAKRVDVFIANSRTTQERIRRTYGRDSVVIHPPVNDRFFSSVPSRDSSMLRSSYFLAVGRLVPYKRFDLIIEMANRCNIPLKIVGSGREDAYLKTLAGPTVEFLGYVSDDKLPAMYQNARALLFPALEDAGIVPIEAQACGTPVIAYGKGGALDTIKNRETGVFFSEQTVESLKNAIDTFEAIRFNPEHIRNHARQFSTKRFKERIWNIIQQSYVSFSSSLSKQYPNDR
jgi:glycosyltransferase involved in cell wall biosynthesis